MEQQTYFLKFKKLISFYSLTLIKLMITHKNILYYTIGLTFISILHHIDHILRYDHSGWPFKPNVNAFTFSLVVYPIIFTLFFIKKKAYRVWTSVVLAILLIGAHVFLETPHDQFNTWAHNSSASSFLFGHPNLLNTHSPITGVISVCLSIILDLGVIALPFIFYKEEGR